MPYTISGRFPYYPAKIIIEAVSRLGEAIREERQVLLRAYRPAQRDTIFIDRTVERFDFLSDYSGVWCYDPETAAANNLK